MYLPYLKAKDIVWYMRPFQYSKSCLFILHTLHPQVFESKKIIFSHMQQNGTIYPMLKVKTRTVQIDHSEGHQSTTSLVLTFRQVYGKLSIRLTKLKCSCLCSLNKPTHWCQNPWLVIGPTQKKELAQECPTWMKILG